MSSHEQKRLYRTKADRNDEKLSRKNKELHAVFPPLLDYSPEEDSSSFQTSGCLAIVAVMGAVGVVGVLLLSR